MSKKRTRAQKIKTASRPKKVEVPGTTGFKISFGPIHGSKSSIKGTNEKQSELKYFRSDLTKVLALTMLALASEIVLWLILKH